MKNKIRNIEPRRNRTIRLSAYEEMCLKKGAEKHHMNESEYVRSLILRGGVDAKHAEDRRDLIRQVTGVASNVNQLVKVVHVIGKANDMDIYRMNRYLSEIKGLLKELVDKWR